MDQTMLNAIVAAVMQQLQTQGTAPKPAAMAQPLDRLAQKDRSLIAGFKRRGIKEADIVLMDRNDPKKPFNVKPYKLWMQEGRMVQKGQHGIKGLFHISQTSEIAPKAQPKAAPKAKAKPVKQPQLV